MACTGKDHVAKATGLFNDLGDKRPVKLAFAETVTVTRMYSKEVLTTSSLPNLAKTCVALQQHGCPVNELELAEARIREGDQFAVVVLKGYKKVPGPLELGGAQCGDILMSLNGEPFFVRGDKDEVEQRKKLHEKVCDEASYPVVFEFARPLDNAGEANGCELGNKLFSSDYSVRFLVQVEKKEELGVMFRKTDFAAAGKSFANDMRDSLKKLGRGGRGGGAGGGGGGGGKDSGGEASSALDYLVINRFKGVRGPCQLSNVNDGGGGGGGGGNAGSGSIVGLNMSVHKINGHVVPLSATPSDVLAAMKRGWSDGRGALEVTWKDFEQEAYIEENWQQEEEEGTGAD